MKTLELQWDNFECGPQERAQEILARDHIEPIALVHPADFIRSGRYKVTSI